MTNHDETFNQQQQEDFTSDNEAIVTDASLSQTQTAMASPANIETREKTNGFSRTVPHGALHAEREEHKKTRAALAQLRAQHAQILEQLGQDAPPDPAQDFLGATCWQAEANQRAKQASAEQQLWQEWREACDSSKEALPDLDGALDFLAETRERQLTALGHIDKHFQDENNRLQQMQAELRDLVQISLERGDNPASLLYELARAHGYAGFDMQQARFKDLGAAQKAARTLAASGGREAGDPALLESLANMSEAEFARWYEANPQSFRQLFAG